MGQKIIKTSQIVYCWPVGKRYAFTNECKVKQKLIKNSKLWKFLFFHHCFSCQVLDLAELQGDCDLSTAKLGKDISQNVWRFF